MTKMIPIPKTTVTLAPDEAAAVRLPEQRPVGQRDVLHAARREYQKLGKMIDESAFRGGA